MNPEVSLLMDALAVAIAAAVMDVQQHRIPNWLTYPAIVGGLLMRSYYYGWRGAMTALGGMLLTAGLAFVFYRVNALGGGDLKLLAALGSVVGPHHAVTILLATGIAGGILALIYAGYHGRMRTTMGNVGSLLSFHATAGLQSHPEFNLDNPKALRMPYGLPIALGTFYALITVLGR